MEVLITGGAGFIGQALVRQLLEVGHRICILDNFSAQVHGSEVRLPHGISDEVHVIRGDVRNADDVRRALAGKEAVVHLAAETGTGQSMYEITRYEQVNIGGTACLLEQIANQRPATVDRLVVASSRAIYGEGKYQCPQHGVVYPRGRSRKDLEAGRFEPRCPVCGSDCRCQPTDESSPCQPVSFYGLTKQVQEQMILLFARALGLGAIALRFQNVYGPGQSLQNPYTGILAIFSSLARLHRPILLLEGGQPTRDFVYIEDVAAATRACLEIQESQNLSLNVGSGRAVAVEEVARRIAEHFQSRSPIERSCSFREGDIRHNLADLSRLRATIGFQPQWTFAAGLERFLDWAETQPDMPLAMDRAWDEMRTRGLLRG